MANVLYYPQFRAFNSNGDPLAGGKVYTYEAGTVTPKLSYTDYTMTVPNSNPVILDAQGSASIWIEGDYKINLTDADDVQQNGFPVDHFTNDSGEPGPAGTFQIASAGGTSDAITADYNPNVTLSNLTTVAFVATAANTTTTPTFAPDGLAARVITKHGGQPLVAGDIAGAGYTAYVEYNSAGTRWELANPAYGLIPSNVLTETSTDTVTNKSFVDTTTYIVDDGDNTKKAQFQLSGITTATTRTITLPDKNGTLAMTSDITALPFTNSFQSNAITMTAGTGGTVAHGLGARPKIIYAYIRNISAELNYAVGDEVPFPVQFNNFGVSAWSDGTANIRYWIATNFRLPNATTGGDNAIDYAKWELRIRAYI